MGHKVKITIAVDNEAERGLRKEHGLSLWIEAAGRKILFDTGQGSSLPVNAKELGIDIRACDALILSHGHYDHTGGVPYVLRMAPDVPVFAHPSVAKERYGVRYHIPKRIGMPRKSRKVIQSLPSNQMHWVTKAQHVESYIGLTGLIPRGMAYEDTGCPFYMNILGTRADLIEEDMALWIQTENGLVICLGCCHAGLVNTLTHVQKITGESRIDAIIGGFHLLECKLQRLEATLAALRTMKPRRIIPCHCTGKNAVEKLMDAFGTDVVTAGYAGFSWSF